MIAKITRGDDGAGLVRYLLGPGRKNEHDEQRVVAAGDGMTVELGGTLSVAERLELGRQMDRTNDLYGLDVNGGHVWHLSLTNPEGDRHLSDAEWSKIAHDTVDRLGFSEAPGRAGCPWVAIGHGLNDGGSEHIHIAVSLVREDGRVASIWQDRVKLSELCSTFERDYGLTVVDGRNREALPGISRAEDELAARRGRAEPERDTLARQIRAASVASKDEAEFVRRLRAEQVLVRPRYADGGRECVTGFSAALRPPPGQDPVWFGGGRLAKDLGLPKLREAWDRSPTADRDAVSEWRSERPPAFEAKRAGAWDRATERVAGVNRHLEHLSPTDGPRWAAVARETAGVVGQLAVRLEPGRPGPLSEVADALARSAQPVRNGPLPLRDGPVGDLRGVAGVAGQARLNARSGPEVGRMVGELSSTVDRLAAAHSARGEDFSAARLHRASAGMAGLASTLAAGGFAVDRTVSKLLGADVDLEDDDLDFGTHPARERDRGWGMER